MSCVNALVSRDPDGGSDYNIIENNTVNAADLGIVMVASTDAAINTGNVIRDNTLLEVSQTPIAVGNGKGFLVTGNDINGAPFGHCIAVGSVGFNMLAQGQHTIANNRMSHCAGNGISLYAWPETELSQNQISGNWVQDCGLDCIALEAGSGASLTQNQVTGNEASFSSICGIKLGAEPLESPDAVVSDNLVKENIVYRNQSGICLKPGATKNHVLKNVAQDQTSDGIFVFADGNRVVGNETHGNVAEGIDVLGADNSIINNTAFNNGRYDVVDGGTGNKWRSNTYETANWQPVIGWAAGDSADGYGTILQTNDGGDAWLRQGLPGMVPNKNLNAVSAIDAANAWVVGHHTILRTRDGGLTWEQQSLPDGFPPDAGLSGVKAIDGNRAWAVGDADALLGTADGHNWSILPRNVDLQFPTAVQYSDVDAVDATHVWAVGGVGPGARGEVVIAFYDGVEWRRQGAGVVPIYGNNALIGVSAVDENNVWAVGGWDLPLVKTTDGGASWQAVGDSVSPDDMNRVVAVTEDSGWIAGDFGSIRRTDDGGQTWNQTPTGVGSYLYTITAMDMQTAWAVGPAEQPGVPGWLLRTQDGENWTAELSPVAASLSGVSFVGARR